MTATAVFNLAGAIMLLGAALFALLTTPRRAELARHRRTIDELLERVDALEDQLHDERTLRVTAETAERAARQRAEHVEAFAVGRGALDALMNLLDRALPAA